MSIEEKKEYKEQHKDYYSEIRIDTETLLFPYHFKRINDFIYIIKRERQRYGVRFTEEDKECDIYTPETEESLQDFEPLQWHGTPTQLTELVQALIECKLLPPELTQREIYSRFKMFFNMDFDHENIKKKIRQRTKDLTPLLEKLMLSMEQYIRKDD